MKTKMMKKLFLLSFCLIACACNQDNKFNSAIDVLGTLPVFLNGQDKLEKTVNYSDGKVNISFNYQPQTQGWVNDVIGDDWVAPTFMKELLRGNIASFTLGSVLKTEQGQSPVRQLLSMMDERKATFVVKNGDKKVELTPHEVEELLNDTTAEGEAKSVFAKYFSTELNRFVTDFNEALTQNGVHVAGAEKIDRAIIITVNYLNNHDLDKIKTIAPEAIKKYTSVPGYCYLYRHNLIFNYHEVDSSSDLVKFTKSGDPRDLLVPVETDLFQQVWKSFQERLAEQKQE